MALKSKVMLILLGLLLLYGLIELSVQRFIIMPRFEQLEISQAKDNLKRSVHAIEREIEHLDTLCHDWSAWDDTYRFVQEPAEEYIESNLSFSTFKDNGLNLLYICNLKGEVVWGKIFDLKTKAELKLNTFPRDALPQGHPLLQFNANRKDISAAFLSGVMATASGPMLVAARPILMSSGLGTMKGVIIMGAFLFEDLVARLADQTRVAMTVTEQTEGIQELLKDSPYAWGKDNPYTIRFINSDRGETITAYPDIQGKPAFVIKTVIERDIINRGYETMRYALLTIIGAGLLVILVIMILMRRMILTPISTLTGHVLTISRTRNLSSRLSVTSNDEIGALAREFDCLLEKIDTINTKLENTNTQLKQDIEKRQEVEDKLHEANKKLVTLATMDGLTQLSNRRRFDDVMCVEWKRGVRDTTPLSLIIFDVDLFKEYNDTYGHQAGDDCLKIVALVVNENVRRVADLAARYGGEEFAVILPNTELAGAVAIAQIIREQVYNLAIPNNKAATGRVTVSAGVACLIPSRGISLDTLLSSADMALYEAKASGRNIVKSSL